MAFTPSMNEPHAQGGAFGTGSDIMLQAGLHYGQQLLQQAHYGGLGYYIPLFGQLHRYFAVDNLYVRRKLSLLVFPFFTKFPRMKENPAAGGSDAWDGTTPATNGGGSSYGPDGFLSSSGPGTGPASPVFGSAAVGTPHGPPSGGASSVAPNTPIHDLYVFDLYLPLMGVITYVMLSALMLGSLHHRTLTLDYLITTTTTVCIALGVEVGLAKLARYVLLMDAPGVGFWDLLALCGYKYVLMDLCLVGLLLSGMSSSSMAFFAACAYTGGAQFTFCMKAISRLYTRHDGRMVPHSRLFILIVAFLQLHCVVWLLSRPL